MSINIVKKVFDILGIDDEDERDYTNDIESYEEIGTTMLYDMNSRKGKINSINSKSNSKIVMFKPVEYKQTTILCDCLKNRKIVIVDLCCMESQLVQRFVDFLSGAVYSVNGEIQEISRGILLLTTDNVDVTSLVKNELSDNINLSWANIK